MPRHFSTSIPTCPRSTGGRRWLLAVHTAVALAICGSPDPVTAAEAESPETTSGTEAAVDLGLHIALPAALPTGQSNGLGLAVEGGGRTLRWVGVVSTGWIEEYSKNWTVSHTELRARGGLGARTVLGRGLFMIKLLGGATVVSERRDRHQGARLGVAASDLTTSSLNVFAAVDVELGAAVEIARGWGVAVFAGPTLHFGAPVADGLGWSGRVAVRRWWQRGER